jgi:hypothetical protein
LRSPFCRIAASTGAVLAGVALLASVAGPAAAQKKCDRPASQQYSFGVMADTQWTNPPGDDGKNPNSVAVDIIRQLNQQFIQDHVKFVIQVGDLVD